MRISSEVFGDRALQHALRPQRNPLLEAWREEAKRYGKIRPKLGIFNDVPWHKFREDEAKHWARAGFDVIILDGEHSDWEGCYGRAQYDALLRLGLTPIQRLSRDAGSRFAECLGLGARGSMLPYATSIEEVDRFLDCFFLPNGKDKPSKFARGAFPVRTADGTYSPNLEYLREVQGNLLPAVQFESTELLLDTNTRRATLSRLNAIADRASSTTSRNDHKLPDISALAFVGAMDLNMRALPSELPHLDAAIHALFRETAKDYPHCAAGGIFGHPSDPSLSLQSYRQAMHSGARLLVAPFFTSDLPFVGAATAAQPFHDALTSSLALFE